MFRRSFLGSLIGIFSLFGVKSKSIKQEDEPCLTESAKVLWKIKGIYTFDQLGNSRNLLKVIFQWTPRMMCIVTDTHPFRVGKYRDMKICLAKDLRKGDMVWIPVKMLSEGASSGWIYRGKRGK